MITTEQLTNIIGIKYANKAGQIVPYLLQTIEMYQINTPLRLCHFLAQVLHESGGFFYVEELASGAAYEGRKDLGNINEGDGVRFKGRAYIQITGRANYQSITNEFKHDFVTNPKDLSNIEYAMKASGWFWNKKSLNLLADKDDITSITKKVNGGLNGFDDRKLWLSKCKKVLMPV